jgi:tRNA-dihydrouridine synthase B
VSNELFCMAPMAGITDFAFRTRLRRNGCGRLFTEMVSAAALARRNRKTFEYLRVADLGPDLTVQLFGSVPGELAEAALAAQEAGFQHVDFNMGCPVRKVVRSGAGAALLRDLPRAADCLGALRRAVSGTLSVKIRSGWDAATQNCVAVGRLAADCGVDALTLHARTRAQGYSGRADWSWVAALVRELPIPVTGNGDVTSRANGLQRIQETGCASIMIGRAALGQPWLFRDQDAHSAGDREPAVLSREERGEDLLQHLEDLIAQKGEKVANLEIRKFLAWGVKGLRGAGEFRQIIQRSPNCEALREEIRSFFALPAAAPVRRSA